jgi:predicted Zn-dependent peptidase
MINMGYISRQLISFISVFLLIFTLGITPVEAKTETPNQIKSSIQPYLDRVIKKIDEFTLENGLKFIILENHQAPVVSFVTYADVGGVDEPEGKTGVAHFLEHLAFKGTSKIGTTNYQEEAQLLDQLDTKFKAIQEAKKAGNQTQITQLETEFKQIEAQANQFVKQNEYGQIVETAGGVGLNAATSADSTVYFYSFPSNKLELWFSLESERFLDPVFREFYKEKDVILEERRMRTDNSPTGQMIESFLDTAYTKHPYKRPVIGYNQDIRNLTTEDVKQFFSKYYVPNNLTIAIVGDVKSKEVKKLAQAYFGRFKAQEKPPQLEIIEPLQTETKKVELALQSQPFYLEGYHRPSINDPDNAVYNMIASILSDGRTSRLYKSLVEEKQVALAAQGFNGFPGDKYPNLMLFFALTSQGKTINELAEALHLEIEKMTTELVTEAELNRVKTQAKSSFLRILDSNMGMARQLAEYEVKTGDWSNLFKEIDLISAVTPDDILRVAKKTFTPENKTIGHLISKNN